MRAWWMIGAVLVGCDAVDGSAASEDVGAEIVQEDLDAAYVPGPEAPLPPPLPIVMEVSSTDWSPGEDATLTAEGAIPGARVVFLAGDDLGATCPPRLGGDCLDITGAFKLGAVTADVDGVATLDYAVPSTLPVGNLVFLQTVVAAGAPYASQVLEVEAGSSLIEDITLTIDGAVVSANVPGSGASWDFDPFGIFDKPDPYFVLWLDGVYVGHSGTWHDGRFPTWGAVVDLTVPEGSVVDIDVYDDDGYVWQGGDEFIGTVTLTSDDLQVLADAGPMADIGTWGLMELSYEVVAR